MTDEADDSGRRRRVVEALRALAGADSRDPGADGQPPLISAFVTRMREQISELVLPTAGLVVIIEGRKEIIDGTRRRLHLAGDPVLLPAGARLDVVNEPDPRSGVYRALFVRFPRALVIEAARLWPQFVRPSAGPAAPVVTDGLCSAILHAAEALSPRLPASRRVVDHRILEIILILAEQGALPLVPKYVDGAMVEAVRRLVRHRLHQDWTADRVAAELAVSEATLRRRLRAEGETLQDLVRAERMQAAYTLLAERDADVADALAATGYRSRSHFARHFHARFGLTPSAARQRRPAPPAA